ncbi:MAG: MBL fold metallo-hydrolase [Anaerolineales bacterium]|jgi:glyoxylase-like metal-dependent hydrolase (beta-lactamase superfamily II)
MDFFHTLDLNFLGYSQAIASYAFPHAGGVALIESGPGSTLSNLEKALIDLGYTKNDVTDVLLTHIHLDHAGASGALARQGATIHVHPRGAPHMIDPEKLLSSAERIYGDQMDRLWGEFLPVPESQVHVVEDGEEIHIGTLGFTALDTPGHANHHHAYLVREVCFSGDVGGIRMPGLNQLRLPMPPPELNLEKWRQSVEKLKLADCKWIAPTHFGVFDDPERHLEDLARLIDAIDEWISKLMPSDPSVEEIDARFQEWTLQQSQAAGISPDMISKYEAANPTWMSAAGIKRYWNKYRAPAQS